MENLVANLLVNIIPNIDYLDAHIASFGINLFGFTFIWFTFCAWLSDKIAMRIE